MDQGRVDFDFGALLKNHAKKHKSKPVQFVSVAGGVQKRFENHMKGRRSSRYNVFDNLRNLSRGSSPAPKSDKQLKNEHRKQQLEKWKNEKEKIKKELAAKKKKPFVTGVPHVPLNFVPPPPPPKSGRVTRSQTAKTKAKDEQKKGLSQSFAPLNALFNPPKIQNLISKPTLTQNSKIVEKTVQLTFEPIQFKENKSNVKQTRSKTLKRQQAVDLDSTVESVEGTRAIDNIGKNVKTQSKKVIGIGVKPLSESTSSVKETIKVQSTAKSHSNMTLSGLSNSSNLKSTVKNNNMTKSRTCAKQPAGEPKVTTRRMKTRSEVIKSQFSSSSSSENNSVQSVSSSNSDFASVVKNNSSNESVTNHISSLSGSESEEHLGPQKSSSESSKTLKKSTATRKSSTQKKVTKKLESNLQTPIKPIPKSESSSEEKLRSPQSLLDVPMTPEQITEEAKKISPCVTLSRGKDKARREMMKRLDEGLFEEYKNDLDSIDHFRKQVTSESKRITEMCEVWDKIMEQTPLPESVQECVLAATGQARLLVSQKMQQFSVLVGRAARPGPQHALVTVADLHGFWDMLFMQVENVDMRFKKLEKLKACNWIEEQPTPVRRKPVPKPAPKPAPRPTAGNSRLREMIAAARRAKTAELPSPSATDKRFEGGFFSVQSPARGPPPAPPAPPAPPTPPTPGHNTSLLKAVLSSEANKASASRNSASMAMLRASLLAKNSECEVASLPQTPLPNLQATPARSILKQSQPNTGKSARKSNKVLFFESDNENNESIHKENVNNTGNDANIDNSLSMEGKSTVVIDKKYSGRKSKTNRLDAVEVVEQNSPVLTRNRRKSKQTPQTKKEEENTPRSTRKKAVQQAADNDVKETTRRCSRRRKSAMYEAD